MRHGNLSRESVVAAYGEDFVSSLERENCEPTGRMQTDGDPDIEYCASLIADNGDVVDAYYYITPEEQAKADEIGDLGILDWVISGYESDGLKIDGKKQ